MAKLQTKWIAGNAVDGSKLRLNNDEALRARNAANSADVTLMKLDGSDLLQFLVQPEYTADPTQDNHLARKAYVDSQISGLGAAVEYKGTYDAALNSPSLSNGVGTTGDLYRVNVAGSQDFGAGSISFDVGDKVVYNPSGQWEKWDDTDAVSSVNSQTGAVVLDTDDVAEGATNKYYASSLFDADFAAKSVTGLSDVTSAGSGQIITAAERSSLGSALQPGDNISELTNDSAFVDAAGAKAAAVADAIVDAVVDVAPSQNAVFDALAGKEPSITAGTSAQYFRGDKTFQTLDTLAVPENTNLYFTDARADARIAAASVTDLSDVTSAGSGAIITAAERTSLGTALQPGDAKAEAVSDVAYAVSWDGVLDVAPSKNAVYDKIESLASSLANEGREVITLAAGDITNGYVELAQPALANSVEVTPVGGPEQEPGVDYTESIVVTNTRITFAGDLAAEAAAGDKLIVHYRY